MVPCPVRRRESGGFSHSVDMVHSAAPGELYSVLILTSLLPRTRCERYRFRDLDGDVDVDGLDWMEKLRSGGLGGGRKVGKSFQVLAKPCFFAWSTYFSDK